MGRKMEGRSRDGAAVGAMGRGRWQAVALTFFFLVTCIAVGANGTMSKPDKEFLKKELGEVPSDGDLRGSEKELFQKIKTVRNKGIKKSTGAAIGLASAMLSKALLFGATRNVKGEKALALRNAVALTLTAGFITSLAVGIKGILEVRKAEKDTKNYRRELVKMVKARKAEEEEEEASSPPSSKAEDDDEGAAAAAAVSSFLEEKEAKAAAAAAGSRN